MKNTIKEKAFTLIELLVVIAIIGILAGILFVAINPAEQTKKAHDAQRLNDVESITKALDMYLLDKGKYPEPVSKECSWDIGNQDYPMIDNLLNEYFPGGVPVDPTGTGCSGYRYYRYPAGSSGCDPSKGAFYVLGVNDMETSFRPHPQSPGFKCSRRDWQSEFDWVVGKFEN